MVPISARLGLQRDPGPGEEWVLCPTVRRSGSASHMSKGERALRAEGCFQHQSPVLANPRRHGQVSG